MKDTLERRPCTDITDRYAVTDWSTGKVCGVMDTSRSFGMIFKGKSF